MKNFYTHLVEIESLVVELDELELTPTQKLHLSSIIDSSLHHAIIDAVLSELSNEDKILFLKYLGENNHDRIWKFLDERATNIEGKIKSTADELKKELREDIKKSKEKR